MPRRPDRQPKCKRMSNTKHRVPNDVPQERVEEEQREVHDIHQRQRKRRLIDTQRIPEVLVGAILDSHAHHHKNRVLETERQEEITLRKLAAKNECPEAKGGYSCVLFEGWVGCSERLRGEVLP